MNDVTQDLSFIVKNAIAYINQLEARLAERHAVEQPQLLNVDEIAALFGVSRRTVADHWISRPDFPAPAVAPSRNRRRWAREDLLKWAKPRRRG